MQQLQLAIFDLDGVICDTAKYHYLAWKRLAQELGFDFTEKDNERLKGVSRMRSLEILLEVGGLEKTEEEKAKLAEKKNTWYVEYILQMDSSELLPGVLDFLEELKENEVKLALGSASKNARTILQRLGITPLFDAIVDGNLVTKAKPDPEVFTLGAELLGIPPENAVVFEDAQAGIEAALAAGMKVIGVGDPKVLKHAQHVITGFASFRFADLLEILKQE
ncbi:MAG TPA: beta-phosphoglucomutase [Firmicutes bacterium]|jgi:beta-phosphoglucomutase|nr:beta-phosphoglucomutase [Bacillota bacterium]